ncbi:MAG: sigma-70 family RNA polymerase sigma factor [Sporichthyaceae bacterium]
MNDSVHDDEITRCALLAGRGDEAAATEFVRATQADIWRYLAYSVDRGHADDLTQETYLRALRGLRTFRGDTTARIWLFSVARRTAVDHFRRRGRRPAVAASFDDQAIPLDPIVPTSPDASGAICVQMLIDSLDEDKRTAFVLTQLHGLSYQEAAEVCGVPIGTVRSRVSRAREHLLDLLAETYGGEAPVPARRVRRP